MAIFIPPPITTADRIALVLEQGELVFDTDLNTFWYGDGATAGGLEVGKAGGTSNNSDYNNFFLLT